MKAGPQLYLKCEWCQHFFEYNGGKRKRWCGNPHKLAAWRANKASQQMPERIREELVRRNGSHECVAGFIVGVFNDDGVCMSCGERAL